MANRKVVLDQWAYYVSYIGIYRWNITILYNNMVYCIYYGINIFKNSRGDNMKNKIRVFFKTYVSWILVIALLSYLIFLSGTWYATNPNYEFFNDQNLVCFKAPLQKCYQIIKVVIK